MQIFMQKLFSLYMMYKGDIVAGDIKLCKNPNYKIQTSQLHIVRKKITDTNRCRMTSR